jgi:hypothetical protein
MCDFRARLWTPLEQARCIAFKIESRGPSGYPQALIESVHALCKNSHMIGSNHLQRGTNRMLTYQAFFTEAAPRLFIAAIIQEDDRLLAMPELEVAYRASDGSVEDVVIARIVRYLNDTEFGKGTPREKRIDPTDYGPWK